MLDAVVQGIFEAGVDDCACGADLARSIDADPIAGKESRRGIIPAVSVRHPNGGGIF